MVQPILALVGVDGVFEVFEDDVHKSFQLGKRQGAFATRKIFVINLLTVVAGCGSQAVQHGAAVGV